MYNGRTLHAFASSSPGGRPGVVVGEDAPVGPGDQPRGTVLQGDPGESREAFLVRVEAMLDAVDAAPLDAVRAQREPWWYDGCVLEVCPRSQRLAHPGPLGRLDLHAKRIGKDCTHHSCVAVRRKAARREARSFGITGSSVSAMPRENGFTAYDPYRAPHGFHAASDAPGRRVTLICDTLREQLLTMGSCLQGRGLDVRLEQQGGYLSVRTHTEAIAAGLEVGPQRPGRAAMKLPSIPGLRAALRQAGLPIASRSDRAPEGGCGLQVGRGEPGQWLVTWCAGNELDGGDAYRQRATRERDMVERAARVL